MSAYELYFSHAIPPKPWYDHPPYWCVIRAGGRVGHDRLTERFETREQAERAMAVLIADDERMAAR